MLTCVYMQAAQCARVIKLVACAEGYVVGKPYMLICMEVATNHDLFGFLTCSSQRMHATQSAEYPKCSLLLRLNGQLADGVALLHALNLVYVDLKPQNVLLDDQLNVKLADFGLSWVKKTCVSTLTVRTHF